MSYTIRNVKKEDLEQVVQVEAVCFPEAEAATAESLQSRIEAFPESFFVAEDKNGAIIGFINGAVTSQTVISDDMFEDVSLHKKDGAYQSIFGLDVVPEWRKQGVATALMEHLIAVTRERGKRGLILTCKDRLISYYEKFGYQNMGVSQSVHGGAVWYDMILEF